MESVRSRVLYLSLVLVLISCGLFAFLYFGGGLKQYLRALSLIRQLPLEKQDAGYRGLYGNTKTNEYGGILAGVTGTTVWVWGQQGLKPFATDQYSLYWHMSGCAEGKFNGGTERTRPEQPRISRVNDTGLDTWHTTVKTGDYLVVIKAVGVMGGKPGSLREVFGMDWWPFLQSDMGVGCKK